MASASSTQPLQFGLSEHVLALVRSPHSWSKVLFGGVCASVLLATAWRCGLRNAMKSLAQTRRVRVDKLFVYPIKSCRGTSLQSVEMTSWGLKDDRRYMIVDASDTYFTQRDDPHLAMIHPDMPTSEGITLHGYRANDSVTSIPPDLFVPLVRATGIRTSQPRLMNIWDDKVLGVDQGDAAAAWLQTFVRKEGLRLVRVHEEAHRPVSAKFGVGETGFADDFHALITSQASVEDVDRRTNGVDITIERFRTNIHVSNCGAFEEDEIRTLTMADAGMKFTLVKPCARCVMTTVNHRTGEITKRGEPSRTLQGFRTGAHLKETARLHKAHFGRHEGDWFFGQNSLVEFRPGAVLRVGDMAEVGR